MGPGGSTSRSNVSNREMEFGRFNEILANEKAFRESIEMKKHLSKYKKKSEVELSEHIETPFQILQRQTINRS